MGRKTQEVVIQR